MIIKPDDGYIDYIVNPKAGASSQKVVSHKFYSFLIANGYDVRVSLTGSLQDGFNFAQEAAARADCALVVVVGGDGVVREVADGLKESSKPLLIVPAGTENLLANELGFDEKFQTVIRTFQEGFTRWLDLGVANGKSFTSIAGFGFDGQVVTLVSRQRRGNIDHFDYLSPVWRTFWAYRYMPLKVVVDGQEIFEGPGLAFVGNISRYAMGLEILRHADFGDGLLDVCIYKCASRVHLVKHSVMTLMKRHSRFSDVIYKQGREITVSSLASGIYTEIDGDPGPSLPVNIKILPHAINVMVPAGAKPAGIRTRILRAIG